MSDKPLVGIEFSHDGEHWYNYSEVEIMDVRLPKAFTMSQATTIVDDYNASAARLLARFPDAFVYPARYWRIVERSSDG
jgi:hypothetical protein